MNLLLILTGVLTGVFGGIMGLGGGILLIPALVYGFGMNQHMAQGTTLAMMLPPVGALAVYAYYQQGQVDIKAALLIGLGFLIGGYFGAKLALGLPAPLLRRIFGGIIILIGLKMCLGK